MVVVSFNNDCPWLCSQLFIIKHLWYGEKPQKSFLLECFAVYGTYFNSHLFNVFTIIYF